MYKDFYTVFNGERDKNVGVETVKRHNLPSTNPIFETQAIKGKEGSLTKFTGFNDLQIEVQYNFYTLNNINEVWRNIKRWLLNIKDNKLFFSDDPEVFYKVKRVSLPTSIERSKHIGKFNAIFICEPFSYMEDGELEINLDIGDNFLFNQYGYFSKPIFIITGSGLVTLKINDKDIVKATVIDDLIIDTERELSYKETIKNISNTSISGKYKNLYLDVGDNVINIKADKTIQKIEIIPNWRDY